MNTDNFHSNVTSLIRKNEDSSILTSGIGGIYRNSSINLSIRSNNGMETEILNNIINNDINPEDTKIEINENIELEYEIKVPQFILTYLNQNINNKNQDKDNLNNNNNEDFLKIEETIDIDDESLLTVEDKDDDKKSNNNKNKENNENKNINNEVSRISRITKAKSINEQQNKNLNIKSEEEQNFIDRLKRYQILFSTYNFDDLERYIKILKKFLIKK